jgi:succinate dehydrogenase/fumarate reductase-like Fe-S protein
MAHVPSFSSWLLFVSLLVAMTVIAKEKKPVGWKKKRLNAPNALNALNALNECVKCAECVE